MRSRFAYATCARPTARPAAVRGVSFEVQPGEIFGLLGPNGAGKTTTVEILEGYRERSGGDVRVLGHDPQKRDRALQERVGIVLQSCGFYPRVTVREAVGHFAKAYSRPRDPQETIALVGLEGKADARTKDLSGGRRVEHQTDDPTELLHRLTRDALARGERLEGLEVARPTLEEVYLELTHEADL